jgi:hypothetical protein
MNYVTRVELHGANEADYEKLHAAMEGKGFSRNIKGNDGLTYWLPTATYHVDTTVEHGDVLNAAVAAANSTGRTNGVIVTAGGSMWLGLPTV